MGRIALFLIAVGGLGYLALHLVVGRLLGIVLHPLAAVSASIIIAVIAWTALIWIAGERFGQSASAPHTDKRGEARRSYDSRPGHDVRPDEKREE